MKTVILLIQLNSSMVKRTLDMTILLLYISDISLNYGDGIMYYQKQFLHNLEGIDMGKILLLHNRMYTSTIQLLKR